MSDAQMKHQRADRAADGSDDARGSGPYENKAITRRESSCNLEGLGGGQMRIRNVDVQANAQALAPQKGDLVCLTDASWPGKTQNMVVGQIDSVGRKENQPLRYDIVVTSRVAIPAQRSVMILINE